MRHSLAIGWRGALVAAVVLVFGLVGVALAGGSGNATTPRVTVTFTDTKLTVSHAVLEAGPATFVLTNKGQKRHALSISGPGLTSARTQAVRSGTSAKLTVTLRQGAYAIWDSAPLPAGTQRWLTVGPVTAPASSKREVQPFPPPAPMDCD